MAETLLDLVLANRILARQGVVDGFGHVSMRDLSCPDHFFISRSMAPALVSVADIMVVDFAGNAAGDDRPAFLERFIHSEIYRARPDVGAIVHSHSPCVIPFGIVPGVELRPVYHMGAFLGEGATNFEIRDVAGESSDMLVQTPALGSALADSLGDRTTVLMRGHGSTVVAPTLKLAVFRAIYLEHNARIQSDAARLGPVTFLNPAEAANAAATNEGQAERAWQLWCSGVSDPPGERALEN